jgi:CubicO group peptidase (beta-lactamase class C family)
LGWTPSALARAVNEQGERPVLASWGDPGREEMAFSATKSVLSVVAGLAFDDGLLRLEEPVCQAVDLPQFGSARGQSITWRHLLDQTSQWEGELWGKPTRVDAQSTREGTESAGGPPGAGWAYNDVRVNLTALALTVLFRRSLPKVLRERIMDPAGASPWCPAERTGAADCGSAPSTLPGSASSASGTGGPARSSPTTGCRGG